MQPKYKLGDRVWYANCETEAKYITCPDCAGTGRIEAIFADGEHVSIGCRNCSCGYDPPTGTVAYHEYVCKPIEATICGIEISEGRVGYTFNECCLADESDLFATEAEASVRAEERAKQHNDEEVARIQQKEKPTRTWAFNASYHRNCIKRAKKELEYHTAKLNVAKIKAALKAED